MFSKNLVKRKGQMKKKVVAAMSGGVDSSVAAMLLKKQGFDVVGVFMKFWSEPFCGSSLINADSDPEGKPSASYGAGVDLRRFENRCCSVEAEKRARKVAKILKIPFYVFNFEKEFKKRIVDYFLREYKAGRTPNPCVVCNKEIKFGLLLEKALRLNADFVATGHYVRLNRDWENLNLKKNPRGQKFKLRLFRAKDKEKDQSYFLWQLNQGQLKHILFPVGNYTKTQVRAMAKKFKLPVLEAPESMEICFIPNANLSEFLKSRIKTNKGKIVTAKGETVGEHQGLHFYTIGQRKGIYLSGGPFYVIDKDLKQNILIVAKNEKDLYQKELIAKDVNWIFGKEPRLPLKVKAKIRYHHQPASAVIFKIQRRKYKILFDRPQRAITSGQSVVFYSSIKALDKGQQLLGGGIIC